MTLVFLSTQTLAVLDMARHDDEWTFVAAFLAIVESMMSEKEKICQGLIELIRRVLEAN